MFKVAGILGVLLIGALLALKHEIYQSGIKDATLKQTAEAAERSIKAERVAGASLAVSERAQAEGEAEVTALRVRAEAAEADAKDARDAHLALAAKQTGAKVCPPIPEPTSCAADLPLLQP